MKRELLLLLPLSYYTLSQVIFSQPVVAQISSDGTTNTIVNTNENSFVIRQGERAGNNLFHSFTDFNVLPEQRVYFVNPVDIDSILSRVTGSAPSNIFGTLGVDGLADLFLINPQGILFGPDAQLDIAGSFYGTTATAVDLGNNGVFSAVAPAQSQLLAVSPSASFWNY